ncbi:MAG: hypothetical protein LBQ44_08070 [Treponema sp.]|nr:hypothetical protein [Treponema sp.]
MALTITAAFLIVAAAAVFVCLYRFTGIFSSGPKSLFPPSEKRIARNLDFGDFRWPEELLELNLPSYKKDFAVFSAFSYSGTENSLTLVYASRAKLDDIRAHYLGLLENPSVGERNDQGVLNLTGTIRGRAVTVLNYFSEVSSLIEVTMEMTGEYTGIIRQKIIGSFPEDALAAAPEIGSFASGESDSGYVMYGFNAFAEDIYANIPVFSRAYGFGGTIEELREKINSLGEQYTDTASAIIGGGTAEIKHDGWLYQVKPLEEGGRIKVALIIQNIPET